MGQGALILHLGGVQSLGAAVVDRTALWSSGNKEES